MKNTEKTKLNMMDCVLIFMASVLIVYVGIVLYLFARMGTEPSTLTIAVFGLMTGECGFMSWIKNVKERKRNETMDKGDEVVDCN